MAIGLVLMVRWWACHKTREGGHFNRPFRAFDMARYPIDALNAALVL